MSAVGAWLRRRRPRRADLRGDLLAGLPGAISSVPDGMASGVLAGVNPVHGLYAAMIGPVVGGLTSGTRLMVITTTSAAALAAASGLSGLDGDERGRALVLLTLLAGGFMIVAGIARLGRCTRFVSYSVMLGFLTGVAANILFGQLADLTGAAATGSTSVRKGLSVLLHPSRIDPASLATGLGALAVLVVLARTPLANVAAVVALVVPTLVAIVAGLDSVARVADGGAIPRGLPLPSLPRWDTFSLPLLASAAAVAVLVLVQGAGVAESAPNPGGGAHPDADFVAQGASNVAASLVGGMPIGGSVGQTSLNVAAGARSRWAAIFSGAWMALILVAFAGAVGKVAMPTLAAILIMAAASSLRFGEIANVLRAGRTSQVAIVATFVATLVLPVATAVGIGVVISLLLQLNQDSLDLSVVRLVEIGGGRLAEQPAPTSLADGDVVVLDVHGSLFYAGARTLQARLPNPDGSRGAAVVIRLRGRMTLGATFFRVVTDYADRLDASGGRLYLSGIDPALADRLCDATAPAVGRPRLFTADPELGASTLAALGDARAWQVGRGDHG